MAAKKGKIPEHIKQKQKKFYDPRADHPIIRVFNEIEDPRKPSLAHRKNEYLVSCKL